MIPGGAEALVFDVELGRVLMLQESEGDVAQDGQVVRGVGGAHAGGILTKGDIEDPMEAVFNAPMGVHGGQEGAA